MDCFTALIVDDDSGLLSIIEEVITDWYPAATIHKATNGQEALAKIRQEYYTFLITDFKMPVMDGNSLLKSLKILDERRHPENILFLSNYLEPGNPAKDHWNVHFMEKLGFQDKLQSYIDQALERREMAKKGILSDDFRFSPHDDFPVIALFGGEIKAEVLDLSPKGMAICNAGKSIRYEKGKQLDFELILPDEPPIPLKGEVVHKGSSHSQSLGVKFVENDGKNIDLINNYIRKMIS